MKAASRRTTLGRVALFTALTLAPFMMPSHADAALAATNEPTNRLETFEHRYRDSAHRLHIDIQIRHIPLDMSAGAHRPTARGGGRTRHVHAREAAMDPQEAAPTMEQTDPADQQPTLRDETPEPTSTDTAPGFFTAPGYHPPLSGGAHPLVPMPLAP